MNKLKSHGYVSSYRFFLGDKLSKKFFFDWRGVQNSTIQSNTREKFYDFKYICAFLDIIEESRVYKQIDEIVPKIIFHSCTENDKCTGLTRIKPKDMYIAFGYPSMKFTFSFPDIIPRSSYYTFAFHLKKDLHCHLLLEDKERFTRRPVIWKKETVFNDPAIFEFSRNNESAVYEFALSIR